MEKDNDILDYFKKLGQVAVIFYLVFWFVIYSMYPLLFLFFSIKIIFNKLTKKKQLKYFTQLKEEFSKFRTMSNRKEGIKKLIISFLLAPVSIFVFIAFFAGLRDFKGEGFLLVWLTILLVIINIILDKIQKRTK